MNERRIVARVQDADLLAGLKAGATVYRARFTQVNAMPQQRTDSADLVVLEAANDMSKTLAEMEAAKGAFPGARLLAIARGDTRPDDVRRLFRSGAADVLSSPVTQDQLLAAMSETLGASANGGARGAVVAVVKAAGGVGASSIAANLGGFLASPVLKKGEQMAPQQVALLDFDIQFGQQALALDIRPRSSVTEILKNPRRLDSHFLDGVLEKHRSGMRLLPAPPAMVPLDAMEAAVAVNIVETAAQMSELVIIDMPGALTDWTGAIMRRADHLVLVATPTIRGVAGARRMLDSAGMLDVEASKWSLVFNRSHSLLDSKDVVDRARTALKTPVFATLSEDAAAREANDRGKLIWESAPSSRFAKDMRSLVTEIERLRERTHSDQSRLPR